MVGSDDTEFQIRGNVEEIIGQTARRQVFVDIPFPAWDPDDPVVELLIESALSVTWQDGVSRKTTFTR
jgi:hypothetical protein